MLFLINGIVIGSKKDELIKTYDVEIPIETDHSYSMKAFTCIFKVRSIKISVVQSIWYSRTFATLY